MAYAAGLAANGIGIGRVVTCYQGPTGRRLRIASLIALAVGPASPPRPGTPTRILGTVGDMTITWAASSIVSVWPSRDLAIRFWPSSLPWSRRALPISRPADYVASTGVKGTSGKIHAVEVRIFPEAARGTGGQRHGRQVDRAGAAGRFKGPESEYTVGPDVGAGQWPGEISLLKPGFPVFVIALKREVAN